MKHIIVHPGQMGMILQSARKHNRISQTELAKMLDASQPAISRLELHPENIKFADLLKMLHRYGLELSVSEKPTQGNQVQEEPSSDRETW